MDDNKKVIEDIVKIIKEECPKMKYEFSNNEVTVPFEINIDNRYKELELELAWKPVIDSNNRLLSREELEKGLNTPRIKELIETCMFRIEFPYDCNANTSLTKITTMDMDKDVGYVKSIDLDKRKVIAMIKNEMYSSISYFEPVLCFYKLGQVEHIHTEDINYSRLYDVTICKVGLMKRELSSYYNK